MLKYLKTDSGHGSIGIDDLCPTKNHGISMGISHVGVPKAKAMGFPVAGATVPSRSSGSHWENW
jgi:hypothetical protein